MNDKKASAIQPGLEKESCIPVGVRVRVAYLGIKVSNAQLLLSSFYILPHDLLATPPTISKAS